MTELTAIQKLAERLRAEQDKKQNKGENKRVGDNASYPFWSIPEGSSCQLRFLPDGDPTNPFFWVNREVIKLVFDGQVGGDYPTDQQVTVTVPCVDMFEPKTCPIIQHTRPWWNQGPEREALARQYYKKKSYIFQGFVMVSPFEEPEVPENPIRRFVINPSIFKIINESMMNPEFEDMPTDYTGGREFTIRKTKQGEYSNYGTSGWSFRTRALNESEMNSIEQFGLKNLSEFLGARPDADGVALIKAMFHDSLDGKPFDFASYGHVYRAYSNRDNSGAAQRLGDPDALPSTPTRSAKPIPRGESVAEVREIGAAKASELTEVLPKAGPATDVLERIRKRSLTTAATAA